MANNKIWSWLSANLLDKLAEALSELKEVNDLLVQISKENDSLSKTRLEEIGNLSFEAASQYGRKAVDYLESLHTALRAGYEDAERIARLSLALQNAGRLSDSLAEQYIKTADKAYGLGGSVNELTAILDGGNNIAGLYGASLEFLAQGMAVLRQTAADLGLGADQATAALGTVITATGQGGKEAGEALKTILLSIRQVADADAILSTINGINGILSAANGLSDFLGPLGTVGTAAAGYLGAKGLGLTEHTKIS